MSGSNNNNNNRRKLSLKAWVPVVATAVGLGCVLHHSGGGGVNAFTRTLPVVRTFTPASSHTALSMSSRSSRTHSIHPATATSPLDLSSISASSSKTSLPMTLCDTEGSDVDCKKDKEPFELHVGRALDTLRTDYAKILTENPNFSIYDPHLEVIDPSKVKVHGLRNYKAAFNLLHAVIKVFYCPKRSSITFRICYDKARQNIRIHFNAQVVPREIFGGTRTTAFVDGISVYAFNTYGNITQHRIEQLVINDQSIRPTEGVIAALRKEHAVTVPSFIQNNNEGMVQFNMFSNTNNKGTSLFALDAASEEDDTKTKLNSNNHNHYPNLDWDALERKNKSRKQFGLKPLSPEEFLELQAQVEQLSQQRVAEQAAAAAEEAAKPKPKTNLFSNLLNGLKENLKDTCESNFDCERPQVCCDFGFQKRCCSSGTLVGNKQLEYAYLPVPVETADSYPPPQGGNNNGGGYYHQQR